MGQLIGTRQAVEMVFTIVFVSSDVAQRVAKKLSLCRQSLHIRRSDVVTMKIGAVVLSGTTVSGVIVMASDRRLKDFLYERLRRSALIEQVYVVKDDGRDRPREALFPERGDFQEFLAA